MMMMVIIIVILIIVICSLLPEHCDYRMKCNCSHLHLLNFSIHAYRLRAGGPINIVIVIIIIIIIINNIFVHDV